MKKPLRVATLFSGIGAPEWALKRLSIPFVSVLACDNGEVSLDSSISIEQEAKRIQSMASFKEEKAFVDFLYAKHSKKKNFVKVSYLANFPDFDEGNYFLDVNLLNGRPLRGDVDLLIGGSPCQSFSTVGFQKGLEDPRGSLFFEYCRLVNEIQPEVFIYENVSGIKSKKNQENWKRMWDGMGSLNYKMWAGTLNAKDFGIPQVRNRFFAVGFKNRSIAIDTFNPRKKESNLKMQDFLIDSTEEGGVTYGKDGDLCFSKIPGKTPSEYILTPAVKKYVMCEGTGNYKTHIEIDRPIARTLLSTMGNHHRAGVDNYVTDKSGNVRALTERECLRLMGFTDDFKIVVSKAQAYKQIGNSMVVDVLMALIKEIIRVAF